MSAKRIEYIDLAKGICIILVVMYHCISYEWMEILSYLRMPFYFFISGLFFKDYGGLVKLTVKKTNKLLIPFVFFYSIAWGIHCVLEFIKPGFWTYEGHFIRDLFSISYINVPMWFLLCLFWCNISFYFVHKFTREKTRLFAIIVLAILGYMLMKINLFCPTYFFQSFSALPFFYLGNEMRHSKIISSETTWKQMVMAFGLIILVFLFHLKSYDKISYIYNSYVGNVFFYYIKSFMMIVAVMLICKKIKKTPFVSFCGRYSIVIMGVHAIFIQIGCHIPNWIGHNLYDDWIQFAFVLSASIISIPLFVKLFPYFTAQKDIIKIK